MSGRRTDVLYWMIIAAVKHHAQRDQWQVERTAQGRWIHVTNRAYTMPQQGWKLRLTANWGTAELILRRALPLLLSEQAHFKVTGTLSWLEALNQGRAGLSQIGKFLTVYPRDDDQARHLAVALDQVTRDLVGPLVPSDRPLRPGSVVSYRYGSFTAQLLHDSTGECLPALQEPDGQLVPDSRESIYIQPDWVKDPFVESGIADPSEEPSLFLGGRYVLTTVLHESPRGTVYLAIDLDGLRTCIIKHARRAAHMTLEGFDAYQRLRHEARILISLQGTPGVPRFYDLLEDRGDLWLVLEELPGRTLAAYMADLRQQGCHLIHERLVTWAEDLATLLATLHHRRIVFGDLSSMNVIVAPDEHLGLIDFETALVLDEPEFAPRLGTPGYISGHRIIGRAGCTADDIYAYGALLYLMATSAEPVHAPNPRNLLERSPVQINPNLHQLWEPLIARCLAPDQERRYETMDEVAEALTHLVETPAMSTSAMFNRDVPPARRTWCQAAIGLGNALVRMAFRTDIGVVWIDPASWSHYRNLNLERGAAGAVLALTDLVTMFGQAKHRVALIEGAQCLMHSVSVYEDKHPGLLTGEAGIGVALLRAGLVLRNSKLIAMSQQLGQWVSLQPIDSPDLYAGAAGRLRFHLLLWRSIGAREHLQSAITCADAILDMACVTREGVYWQTYDEHADSAGQCYTGYGYGAAGIADALLDLYLATKSTRLLAAAVGVAQWLREVAEPQAANGVVWPKFVSGPITPAFWSHGSAGIGSFLLRVSHIADVQEAADLALQAATAVTCGTRWSGPFQWQGLAGNLEFLLEIAAATRQEQYAREAMEMGRLLIPFAHAMVRSSRRTSVSDAFDQHNPGLLSGIGGVISGLLQLARYPTKHVTPTATIYRYAALHATRKEAPVAIDELNRELCLTDAAQLRRGS